MSRVIRDLVCPCKRCCLHGHRPRRPRIIEFLGSNWYRASRRHQL